MKDIKNNLKSIQILKTEYKLKMKKIKYWSIIYGNQNRFCYNYIVWI
jgi:hypothetical protein